MVVFFSLLFLMMLSCGGIEGDDSGMSELEVIEIREMNSQEFVWWGQTVECLFEKGRITEEDLSLIVEPTIFVVEEDNFQCDDFHTSSCAVNGCDLYFSERLIGRKKNAFIFRHEYTHCIEFAVTGSTGHNSDWWQTNGASVCQSNENFN